MWGGFIAVFVGLWILQIILTITQMKHYRQTVKEMSNRSSGYLGVGVEKRKFGIGTVLILVTDTKGIVIDCKVMSGVTVFSRFHKCKRFIGLDILMLDVNKEESMYEVSLKMAVEKIQQQINQPVVAL